MHHRLLTRALLFSGLSASALLAAPQDPNGGPDRPAAPGATETVARMMKFDKNKDGKLSKAEITDARLVRLWTRADADKDGSVTREELEKLATAEESSAQAGGPGGFGGPGGPGGPGGFGGPMGPPPKPGEVLPQMLRNRLKLTTEQQQRLDELQKDVDARMAKILTDSQKAELKQMSMRGPGGPGGFPPGGRGGRGGPGGPGGFGGPPPGGPDGPGNGANDQRFEFPPE